MNNTSVAEAGLRRDIRLKPLARRPAASFLRFDLRLLRRRIRARCFQGVEYVSQACAAVNMLFPLAL